jgi:hypothetical protein
VPEVGKDRHGDAEPAAALAVMKFSGCCQSCA